ncbi:MAG: proline--tRNA ligase, partial [Chloroflexota bacterium]
KAAAFREGNTVDVASEQELAEIVGARKFARAYWEGDPEGEERIKQATGATTRCVPLEQSGVEGKSITTGKPTTQQAIFARAY